MSLCTHRAAQLPPPDGPADLHRGRPVILLRAPQVRLDGRRCGPKRTRGSVNLDVDTSVPDPLEGWQSRTQRLTFDYTLTGAHLALTGPPGAPVAHGNFAVGSE